MTMNRLSWKTDVFFVEAAAQGVIENKTTTTKIYTISDQCARKRYYDKKNKSVERGTLQNVYNTARW